MISNNDKKRKRVIALLTRDEMEYLDKIGMDSLFSTGSRLSRIEIMSALVDAAKRLGITGKGAKDKYELLEKIIHITTSQTERREFPRFKKGISVTLKKADAPENEKRGFTQDISLGGFSMQLAAGDDYKVGDVIGVELSDSKKSFGPMRAVGRVVWKREFSNNSEIGVMFTHIENADNDKFCKYLNTQYENGEGEDSDIDNNDM
ncbi:MAG: PilZ domain-containing protein [Candidatus Omnitrophica bacterium]|nr:PilZ domain-containing protein [Candidatus Omnitrophota bacterium]